MNGALPAIVIDMDITNPGQFFACCGLLELAHRLWPGTEGWFGDTDFSLMCPPTAPHDCIEYILRALATCSIRSDEIQVPTTAGGRRGGSPEKIAPVQIGSPYGFRLDWWISGGQANVLKLWSGNQSAQDIVPKLQRAISLCSDVAAPLLDRTTPMKGRFGVDPRSAWEALHVGFSPHAQDMEVETYPIVELLAAVGLQRFRPLASAEAGTGMFFRYAAWCIPLPASVGAAACMGLLPAARPRWFKFALIERGKYKGLGFAVPLGEEQ